MAEAGLVLRVVGMINQLAQRLSNFKKRCEDFGLLPDNWDSSIKSFEDCRTRVERIEARLENDKESISELATSTFRTFLKNAEEYPARAETILKSLEDAFKRESSPESASGGSHAVGNSSKQGFLPSLPYRRRNQIVDGRPVNEGELFSRVNKVKTALEKFDATWKEAEPAIERVTIALGIPCDEYRAHFDEPPLPKKVVLNFIGDTMEAFLKREVLSNSVVGRVTAAVVPGVLGAVGMGGVGKTVALQGLCYDKEVRGKYFDGVFFMTLGQDAAEEDVVEGVARFVESSGGKSLARDIANKRSTESAARQASLWFKGRCALFVCDDIWSFDGHPVGYLGSLKLLLCNSPSSAMMISTREKSISQQFLEVKFSPREVRGEQSLNILAKYAGIETESLHASSDTWAAFRDILDVCGGLPVALSAAGTSLRNVIEENGGRVGESVLIYVHELKEKIESVGDEHVGYRGLRAVVETSLKHCEKWARGEAGRWKLGCELSVREKFEALSVLRKQAWIPRTCLERLWETNERATKQLMSKLSDMHLVLRRWNATPAGGVDGLALHDLVLEQAKTLSIENNRVSLWHARFLDGYIRKGAGNVVQSNTYNCREWWDCEKVPEDGYIEKNLARHLAMSEGCELEWLLSDVRWLMRRMKVGGIVALRDDFQELWDVSGRVIGADAMRRALEESWVNMNKSVHAIPFEMYGRLQSLCPSSEYVQRFLSSVSMHVPKPHYVRKHELRLRADSRQLGLFRGHEDGVRCIAMSGDGSRIVSGFYNGTVRVWDVESGECVLGPFHGHEHDVVCVAISGDGSRIVSGSWDKSVLVWDGESGECVLGPLRGHEGYVLCVAMNGEGSRIVSGSWDKSVRVWDGESGECVLGPLRGHEKGVVCVAMSGDGSLIFSGSVDKSVRVWDGKSGKCVRITGLSRWIRSLEFDAGGDLCVVHTTDEVFLLDASTGTKMQRPGYMIHGSNGKIYATGQNAKKVQVATMPFDCVAFCYSKRHSKAAAGLVDGQVVIGELLL